MTKLNKVLTQLKLPENPLLRLLIINGFAGVGVAALVLVGIMWSNIGNLRVLVQTAENPFLPLFMLAAALVTTLGSVVMGSAIMLLGDADKVQSGPGGGGRLTGEGALRPIPIAVRSRRGRDSQH
jgi:hypothetical protein